MVNNVPTPWAVVVGFGLMLGIDLLCFGYSVIEVSIRMRFWLCESNICFDRNLCNHNVKFVVNYRILLVCA